MHKDTQDFKGGSINYIYLPPQAFSCFFVLCIITLNHETFYQLFLLQVSPVISYIFIHHM